MAAELIQDENSRAKKVLVVDDNLSQLSTLAAILSDEGFETKTCSSPQLALQELEKHHYGVAIIDLRMPGLNGIELLEKINDYPRPTHAIIYTAHGDFDSARRALNLKAFAFLEKMSNPDELVANVHRAYADLLTRHNRQLQADIQSKSELLEISEQKAKTALHALSEAVVITDAKARIDYMNPAAESLSGWKLNTAQGKRFDEVFNIFDGNSRAVVANPASHCIEVNRTISPHEDTLMVSKNGNEYWIRGAAAPLHDLNSKAIGAVLIINDVTEQVKSNRELRNYRTRLEDLVSERTAALQSSLKELESFSYSVSHDLRSPLRSIDGFSHLLLEKYSQNLDDSGRDALQRVRNASQRMGKLIDDLLQLSRITRRPLSRELIDFSDMASDIARSVSEATPQRSYTFNIAPKLSAIGDASLLRIALENLIHNAAKYSELREPSIINLDSLPTHKANKEKVFCISDNGVGFDNAYAHKLFGAFQRLHGDEFEGSGIGLATTARIIERHGGRIWAEGSVGKGAKFYFSLPE